MDPIVVVRNCKLEDLRADLQAIVSEAWNSTSSGDHFLITLTRESTASYILTFPHGITFADFLWVVNFLRYPFEEHEDQTIAHGYWDLPSSDHRFPEELHGQLCEFYSSGDSEEEAFAIHVVPRQGGHFILSNYTKDSTRARLLDDHIQFAPPPDLTASSFPIETFKGASTPTPRDYSNGVPSYRLASRIYFILLAAACIVAYPFAGGHYDVISMVAALSFVAFCSMFHEQILLPGVWNEWTIASIVLFLLTLPLFPRPSGAPTSITLNLRLFRVPLAAVIVASAIKHRLPKGRALSSIEDRAIWGPLYFLATLILAVLLCLI